MSKMVQITENELKEMQRQIREYRAMNGDYDMMRKLYKTEGFLHEYFERLKSSRTQLEAFNQVNDLYFELFGEFRYSSYHSFIQSAFPKSKKQN